MKTVEFLRDGVRIGWAMLSDTAYDDYCYLISTGRRKQEAAYLALGS